jgi:hypothetical protein
MKIPHMLAFLAAITVIGSVAATNLVQQQASAIIVCKDDFMKLSAQFQEDVLNLKSTSSSDINRQLAKLFDNYQLATTKELMNETTMK